MHRIENPPYEKSPNAASYLSFLAASLYEQQKNGTFCDVVLIAGLDNVRITAHRCVLSIGTPFFATMFHCDLKESTSKEILLHSINGKTLQAIVTYIYNRQINLEQSSVVGILKHAHMYMMDSLVQLCEDYLIARLNQSTFVEYDMLANVYNMEHVIEQVNEFVDMQFMEIYYWELRYVNFERFKSFLERNTLCCNNEMVVFDAIQHWILLNYKNRIRFLPDLLKQIRFKYLDQKYINEYIGPMCKTQQLKEILQKALDIHNESTIFYSTKCRSYPSHIVYGVHQKNILLFDESHKVWKLAAHVRSYNAIYILGKSIIMQCVSTSIFFADLGTVTRSSFQFDFLVQLGALFCSFCLVNNDLYILGGNYVHCVEKPTAIVLNICTKETRNINNMIIKRRSAAAAYFENCIYVAGGYGNNTYLSSVEKYDPDTGIWTKVASLNCPRSDLCLIAQNNYLYAIGGLSCCVERYNVALNTWELRAPMQISRSNFHVAIYNNQILAIGGKGGAGTVELYDDQKDCWVFFPSMTAKALC